MDISSEKLEKSHTKRPWHCKRETEFLSIAAENNARGENNINPKIDNTQPINKSWLYGEKDETLIT